LRLVVPGAAGIAPHGDVRVIEDRDGLLAQRYDALPGTVYTHRPDQHVSARWRVFDSELILDAIARASCNA
jgi:3-(3-hydroxy-phenyl)propionate hydroxylase